MVHRPFNDCYLITFCFCKTLNKLLLSLRKQIRVMCLVFLTSIVVTRGKNIIIYQ